jgi:hypothetical protein
MGASSAAISGRHVDRPPTIGEGTRFVQRDDDPVNADIDTAAAYGNERQVGEAVRSSGLDRCEVFLRDEDLDQRLWL